MLKQFIANYCNSDKIINILIVLYAAVLPLGHAMANLTLLLMVFFLTIYAIKNRNKTLKNITHSVFWIFLFSILFFVYAFSLLYSDDIEVGYTQVYKKSPIFILTVFVIILRKRIITKTVFNAMNVFSYSVTFVCVISILLALYNCYAYKPSVLLYCSSDQNLASTFISYHKLYLSLYITIAIFFLLFLMFYEGNKIRIFSTKSFLVSILFFTLILLGSRNSLVVSTLVIIGFPLVHFLKNKMILKFFLFSTSILIIVFSSIYFNPLLQEKIKEAINYENQYNVNKRWGGTSVRKLIWEYSYTTFKKSPIVGVGVGDAQKELNASYLEYTETSALKHRNYNTHNDILQIAVTTGILGISLYLFSLIYIIRISFNKKNYIHCLFVILFLVSGLTESFLERDMGIRVYSFFTILLFIYSTRIYENSSNTQ
ncbi:O-antigen ligase family protein [uncultured Algibacter sp.]|uniref:O-antigen ligase family protein n=1 Tax=uncultured Algibacter sp. TaxID=298659 RepID=UPI0030EF6639|tara:strand:- start:3127 stop:4410 length:1284 start_codon:yes stop_codon:yes gene_type:complete